MKVLLTGGAGPAPQLFPAGSRRRRALGLAPTHHWRQALRQLLEAVMSSTAVQLSQFRAVEQAQ